MDLRLSPCEVRIGLAVDDFGTTTVGRDWADGAALDDRATWTQRVGKRREQGLANLGWDAATELYRPILSYEELSGLLQAGTSQLHDALARILGLEQITDAGIRLTDELKRVQEPERQAKELGGQLKDTEIPPEVLMRVLPGLCRMAVEAAARDVFYAHRFAAGTSQVATEASWDRAGGVSSRVAHEGLKADPRGAVDDLQKTVEDLLEVRS